MKRYDMAGMLALFLLLAPAASRAEAPGTIRIGVPNHMSGPYADLSIARAAGPTAGGSATDPDGAP